MAATYLTSGENTKSAEDKLILVTPPPIMIHTDNAPFRHLPMTHGILRGFVPVASSTSCLGPGRIDGMPWGNSDKDAIQWVPLPG
jgi:hypothetical protein